MACDYNRRMILSLIKTMNCSLTIAVKRVSPNMKFVLQMRLDKRLIISAKVLKAPTILIVATF